MKVQEVEEVGKSDKGFTLVELLIVIVILGILATVTVFAVTGITNKGKTSACQSDAKTIQTAEEAYSANHGTYAATSQALVDDGLMHSPSTKFNIFVHVAGPATAADSATGAPAFAASTVDTYAVVGVTTGDCTGMTF